MQNKQKPPPPAWRRRLVEASLRKAYEAVPACELSEAMEARLAEWRLSDL